MTFKQALSFKKPVKNLAATISISFVLLRAGKS